MGHTVHPDILTQVRPLVAQGLNGTQIAQALGLKERDGRWYAAQVRAEGATNGQGSDPTRGPSTIRVKS